MLLSNSTIQVNFTNLHEKYVISRRDDSAFSSNGYLFTYVDSNRHAVTFELNSLSELAKYQPNIVTGKQMQNL